MEEELKLTLPERPILAGKSKLVPVLLSFLLLLAVVNLVLLLVNTPAGSSSAGRRPATPEALRQLALKMEDQVPIRAAEIWAEYLEAATLKSTQAAKIWYRVGKIYQKESRWQAALEAFYRSENSASVADLETEINLAVQTCLEKLGKVSALQRELSGRVAFDSKEKAPKAELVAEIGNLKISAADLDYYVEQQIENQLAMLGAKLPQEQLNAQKEELLKKLSGPQQKLQILNQLVMEEVLFRKAKQQQVDQEPSLQRLLLSTEKQIVGRAYLQQETDKQIKLTEVDLKTYYEAHKDAFRTPEQAEAAHILVPEEEFAKVVLKELEEGLAFEDLASKYSRDEKTRKNGGRLSLPIETGSSIPELGGSEEIVEEILKADQKQVLDKPLRSSLGWHVIKVLKRSESKEQSFEEVQGQIYRDLRNQKEAEFTRKLMKDLQDEYDVVIHMSRFQQEQAETKS